MTEVLMFLPILSLLFPIIGTLLGIASGITRYITEGDRKPHYAHDFLPWLKRGKSSLPIFPSWDYGIDGFHTACNYFLATIYSAIFLALLGNFPVYTLSITAVFGVIIGMLKLARMVYRLSKR